MDAPIAADADVLSALLFGADHLPVLFAIHVPVSALVAHGFGDICLHVLPLLAG